MPGGGFTGNYYDVDDDDFVNLKTPPPGCDLLDDPGECIIPPELRGPLLGLDEDEGANTLYSNGKSWYHALQTSLQKRFSAGLHVQRQLHVLARRSTTSRTRALFQIEHDQTRPELNKALSDFHRKHRLILSWAWDLPFRGNAFVEGWQIAGIGTFQSGRPFTITDGEFSAVLVVDDRSTAESRAGRDARGSDDARIRDVASRQLSESRRVRELRDRDSATWAGTP